MYCILIIDIFFILASFILLVALIGAIVLTSQDKKKMNAEYLEIFLQILFSVTLSTVISGTSYLLGTKQPDSEKVSVYECGFDPLGTSRTPFSVKNLLVGILFLVFDLEIPFIFP